MFPIPGGIDPKLLKYGLIAVAVAGGGFLIYRAYNQAAQDSAQQSLDNSPEAAQADNLLKLLHPKSYEKLNILTAALNPLSIIDIVHDKILITDKAAIVKASLGIKKLAKVEELYANLTKNTVNLIDDLRNTLSPAQMTAFIQNASANAKNSKTDLKPFTIYANPTGSNLLTATYNDAYFTKPLYNYKPGAVLGVASSLVSVPFKDKTGNITSLQLYYIKGVGLNKDKMVYVLASQVSKTKPL